VTQSAIAAHQRRFSVLKSPGLKKHIPWYKLEGKTHRHDTKKHIFKDSKRASVKDVHCKKS
jgi:hypothetical protein